MKLRLSIAFLLLLSLRAPGQTTIRVIIKNKGQHRIEKVDCFDQSQQEMNRYPYYKDSLVFKFKKNNIDCYNIRYHENGKMYRQQIWLDPGDIRIEARLTDSSLVIDTVLNSPFYYASRDFNTEYTRVARLQDSAALNDFLLASFEKNIQNPFSIHLGYYYLLNNQNSKPELLKLKALTDKQGNRFSWFLLYPNVVERMNKILADTKIDPALYTFLDKKKKIASLPLNGASYYVLDFWFLGCVPCIRQHAEIKKELASLKQKGVELIGVSTDTNLKKWKEYLEKHDYKWPNYLEYSDRRISIDLSLATFPTYLVLDGKGEIVDTYNSFTDVLKKFQIGHAKPQSEQDAKVSSLRFSLCETDLFFQYL